jgi:HEAT repeat protein
VDFLLARESEFSGKERLTVFLGALGNTGDGAALPSVAKYLDHSDETLRQAAVGALKRMPAPQADEDLARLAIQDSSPDVRVEALESMSFRRPSAALTEAARRSLTPEQPREVRLAAMGYLATCVAKDPNAREALLQASLSDPDEGLRQSAAEAVKEP